MKPQLLACLALITLQFPPAGKGANANNPRFARELKPPTHSPRQEIGKEAKGAADLHVTVSGELILYGRKVTERELVRALKEAVSKNKDLKIKIRSHVLTRPELTKRTIDLCEASGVWNLSWESDK